MNLKKKLSILTAFAVFQAFAVIPANAQTAESSDTTSVNTAKVKSVEVLKKEQPINESEVKTGTATPATNQPGNTQPANNESTIETETETETETTAPSGTEAKPVNPETDEEQGEGEDTTPTPVEVEQPTTSGTSATAKSGGDLTLYMNSSKMVQDGKTYTAGQPMAVKNGVSYVAIRALVDRVGYDVKYDNTTKETIIISGTDELRFKTNSKVYTVNGEARTMKGAAYQEKNTFMIPLTSITQALKITYTVNQPSKTVVLKLNSKAGSQLYGSKRSFCRGIRDLHNKK